MGIPSVGTVPMSLLRRVLKLGGNAPLSVVTQERWYEVSKFNISRRVNSISTIKNLAG